MARKKKENNTLNYNWSKYQLAIFDYIEHEQGHLVVEACAGAGKSTTLLKCIDLMPNNSKILLSAFNTDIVNELKKKTKGKENVDVRTLHSLGLLMIKRNLPQVSAIPETFKYDSFIKNNIKELSSINTYTLKGREYFKYIENIKKYVDFGRFYLCQTEKDLDLIEDRYDIETIADEKEVAIKVMEWGKNALETIDFIDMVWLPNVLYLKPLGLLYDFIMIDEVQDMNKAEREMVFKCFKMGTRMISVGDKNQCQPEGTKILLPDGTHKNIEDLKVGDYVVTYNQNYGNYVGYKHTSVAGNITYQACKKITQIESHNEGELIEITTESGKKTYYTPNHICYCRLNPKSSETAYCVYIMRNSLNMYRIGKTKLRRNGKTFSLNHRMRCEGCDTAWIIGMYDTEKEARISEIINSIKFGIPQIIFDYERASNYGKKSLYFNNDEIIEMYKNINENIEERVKKCLEFHNKKFEFPFIEADNYNYISTNHFTTIRACNLFPKYMEMNIFDETNTRIKKNKGHESKLYLRTPDVICEKKHIDGRFKVYSLDVECHHNYVADGILTHNCIYSFSGSDPQSFQILKSRPNTVCLPLSISYRCGKNIVKFAQNLVSTIEADDNAVDGEIIKDAKLDDINDGDMILCRNNAPLVKIYYEFLKMGKKCHIRGKEIGNNLKALVKSTRQDKLNADCMKDGVFVRLYNDLFISRNKLMEKYGIDADTAMNSQQIQNKLDMINALEILAEGINTSNEIIEKIDEIFPKRDKKSGIALSTIHKAKGLEAENVYIACNSLMPSKSAKKDWEFKQEFNLMYVAYTRAKKKLGFIDEDDFKKFDSSNAANKTMLKRIEMQVNQVLNNSTRFAVNKNNAKDIINNAKIIDINVFRNNNNNVNLNKSNGKRKVNAFADLLKNKRKK